MTTIDPLAARLAQLVKAQAQTPNAGVQPNTSFEDLLAKAMQDTVQTSKAAEKTSMQGLVGEVSKREVVEAVTEAELALQQATAIRDRVISAYQDIIRMPI